MEGVCHDDLVRDFHRILLSSEVRELNDEVAASSRTSTARGPPRTRRTATARPPSTSSRPTTRSRSSSTCPACRRIASASCSRTACSCSWARSPRPYTADRGDGTFHLVERGFGRFARAVRLDGAFDGGAHARGPRRRRAARHRPEDRGTARPGDPRRRHHLMNILFIGDIFGRPGRDLVRRGLRPLVDRYAVDFVIANVENAAGGFGITREIGDALARLRRRRDDVRQSHLGQEGSARLHRRPSRACCGPPTTRPARRAAAPSWRAQTTGGGVGVINVMGRVFMAAARRPVRRRRCAKSTRSRAARASSSWTSTPRRRPRRSRWAGTSTAR